MTQPLNDRASRWTVLIIDRCASSREGLRIALETEPGVSVIGEARTLADGIRAAKRLKPQLVILDLDFAPAEAPSALRELLAECPACTVILIALILDPLTCAELLSVGAAACVEKDLPQNLLSAFRAVRQRASAPS